MRRQLREDTVATLLVELGVLPRGIRPEIRPLSGGVANVVLAVRWHGGEVVVKQALPRLRVKADWAFDPARTRIERECLELLARILPAGSVPHVVAYDAEDGVLAMTHAPPGGVPWKIPLLAGEADPAVAARVGALLGLTHRRAPEDVDAPALFREQWPLIQGRVEPFHRSIAEVHPDLRHVVDAEVDRLLTTRTTLVLGDCSPKNVIAYPDRVLLLDLEVAHWGDPAFDVAFMLAHLTLKARHAPSAAAALRRCADAFMTAYADAATGIVPPDDAVIAELACLLLARVDGKSPVEYLDHARDAHAVRAAARTLLLHPPTSLPEALDRAFAHMIDRTHATP